MHLVEEVQLHYTFQQLTFIQNGPAMFSVINASLAQVGVLYADCPMICSCCAGIATFIHPHLGVTCYHNLKGTDVGSGFYLHRAGDGKRVYGKVAWASEAGDLVVFACAVPQSYVVPTYASADVMELPMSLATAGVLLTRQASSPLAVTLLPVRIFLQVSV